MSKNRIKTKLSDAVLTRTDVEALVHDIANIKNNERRITADMDSQLAAIRHNFEGPLALIDAALKEKTAAAQQWAESHPEEFGKRKSIDFTSGTIGFRTGTPKLALLSRAWNWEKALEAVVRILPNFIRNKPEIDKEAILGQADELKGFLPHVGLKVTQAETFYVEPDLTPLETREVTQTNKAA